MTYRVIQWGTGSVGSELLSAILGHHDDLELVGVRVYSDDKDGIDAGQLVGREPVGVRATTDVTSLLELGADCVLYTPRDPSIDDVCALLASGKNVVTTSFLFHPKRIAVSDRDRVAAACAEGGSTDGEDQLVCSGEQTQKRPKSWVLGAFASARRPK